MITALLVVDMQQSLMDDGPWKADDLVKNVASLVDKARRAGAPIFFVADRRVEPDPGFHPGIKPLPSDVVVGKSYCDAFLDPFAASDRPRSGHHRAFLAKSYSCVRFC